MATDLRRLSVSLTKHGAHKLATLLRIYDRHEVLNHLSGSVDGVNIELAQARKNLSADANGEVPELWDKARGHGEQVIDSLVLIAIVSSHYSILDALIEGRGPGHGIGVVRRDAVLGGKAFTNVAHIIEQLGYSVEHRTDSVSYDFSRLFTVPHLNVLAHELLEKKLRTAGWAGERRDLSNELVRLRFHDAFGVSEEFFRRWLSFGEIAGLEVTPPVEDVEFFGADEDDAALKPFSFVSGHTPKKTGTVSARARSKVAKMTLLHNHMQTELFKQLCAEHGKDYVGTEVPSGVGGTKIDLVVKTSAFCWFYEIKTAGSVKACIREAIPQLLEYAYWRGDADACDRLIIVGPKPLTKQAEDYLALLRARFGLQLHYEHLSC